MEATQVFIAVTLDSGQMTVLGFFTQGRGPTLPDGAEWVDQAEGWWSREPNDKNIFSEISRVYSVGPQPVKYRLMTEAERVEHHARDRQFRDALKDDGEGLIIHDMPRAREVYKKALREQRVELFAMNDIALRDAMISGDQLALAEATATRDKLRDVTEDPAIEATQTVDDLKALELFSDKKKP